MNTRHVFSLWQNRDCMLAMDIFRDLEPEAI